MTAARHTIVKVCGLTRFEDAEHAIACGADWLGFIVSAGGPREIGADGMAAVVSRLPGATGVAVLAAVSPREALTLAQRAGASRLQLHRVSPSTWPADFPLPCAFVAAVDADGRLIGELAPPPHLVHLDAAHPTLTGGTGVTLPWARLPGLCGDRPFMLAGGLDGSNVAEAIAIAHPFGVDAASRLEYSPGIKDPDRVKRFVEAARLADERSRG
ncbi:MAG: phosphoribosylanthranilate isomerase [Candidatus Eisenbacteria bacterium]|uniref:N-(5'-phosphoribosyl)anthranilate isomerase n=1 Tax=Eiseniibacteriota bacterium TaxID=2212470 RepID=A0A849SQS4_UNCEI|nr:phosphoribosylanthranilate isomerase [Candidatus Eisenbacteria bacterium]